MTITKKYNFCKKKNSRTDFVCHRLECFFPFEMIFSRQKILFGGEKMFLDCSSSSMKNKILFQYDFDRKKAVVCLCLCIDLLVCGWLVTKTEIE